jgi:hypothetical protein
VGTAAQVPLLHPWKPAVPPVLSGSIRLGTWRSWAILGRDAAFAWLRASRASRVRRLGWTTSRSGGRDFCSATNGAVCRRLADGRLRYRYGREPPVRASARLGVGCRPKRERDQRRGRLPFTEGKQVRPPFVSALCRCLAGSHRIPVPTRNHVSCMAPSAAAFGPGTRQSAVSACWLRGVRASLGREAGAQAGGSVVADVPHPAPLGTAAQDCPLLGRSFVVG